jgi:hypothetical protein
LQWVPFVYGVRFLQGPVCTHTLSIAYTQALVKPLGQRVLTSSVGSTNENVTFGADTAYDDSVTHAYLAYFSVFIRSIYKLRFAQG